MLNRLGVTSVTDGRVDSQIADSNSACKMFAKNDYKDDKMVN